VRHDRIPNLNPINYKPVRTSAVNRLQVETEFPVASECIIIQTA